MTREKMEQMFDNGDLYGLALAANKAMLAKYHPEAGTASLIVDMGKNRPLLHVPVIADQEPSEPALVSVPGPSPR